MKCPKCTLQLPDNSAFCHHCGTKIVQNTYEHQSNCFPSSNYQPEHSVSVTAPLNNSQMPTLNHANDVVTKETSGAKNKYCKRCGGRIDQATKKCTACGKQYFRVNTLILVVLSLLVLGSAGLNVFQYISNQESLIRIEELEKTVSSKQKTVSSQKSTISTQKEEISDLEKEVEELRSDLVDYIFNLHFYKEHAGIVPDDGTKMYHIYGCDDLDTSSFWIYNIEAAEQKGYYPCPTCH